MGNTLKQLQAIWKKLGINQKATILFMMVGLLVGLGALIYVARRPSFALLYSDLDEKNMSAIVSFLKESKVPYRLIDGGRGIMVPEGQKYDLRIGMADKGVLSTHLKGLKLWEEPGFGVSGVGEQMLKRRAIQEELSRTLMHIEQVAWADVQIAEATERVFAKDQQATTASIVLKLHPGRHLTGVQVEGVCRLVAGSVEGLEPRNVSIIDERGNPLNQPESDAASADASSGQNFKRSFEEYLAAKAQAMLDKALGSGKSGVKVSATLNMDRVQETQQTIDVEGKIARVETLKTKSSSGGAESGKGTTQSEEESKVEYDYPKSERTVQSMPGAIKRLSVAVVLDPTYVDAEGNDATYAQEKLDEFRALVEQAVGCDKTRNDTITLTTVGFRKPPVPDTESTPPASDTGGYVMRIAKHGSTVLATVVFVVFAVMALRKVSRGAREGSQVEKGPRAIGTLFDTGRDGLAGEGDGHVRLHNRVKKIITNDPVNAARMIRSWIADQEEDAGHG